MIAKTPTRVNNDKFEFGFDVTELAATNLVERKKNSYKPLKLLRNRAIAQASVVAGASAGAGSACSRSEVSKAQMGGALGRRL